MEKQSILKIFVSKTNTDLEYLADMPDVQIVNTIERS